MNQILHQIVNQIKEIVDFINNLELRANEYTDQEILKLKNDLEEQLATLEQTLKTYTDNSIDTYNAEIINPQLNKIRNTIDNVNTLLNNRITEEVNVLNRRINSVESSLIVMINETKEYLEELIKKGNQLVYSGISGKKIPIQDALKEIANASKQMLSYNWNTIDILKIYETEMDLSSYYDFNHDQKWWYKNNNPSVLGRPEGISTSTNTIYLSTYIEYNSNINFYVNGVIHNEIARGEVGMNFIRIDLPISLVNEGENIISFTVNNVEYIMTILYFPNGIPMIENKITFNSIKSQMQNEDIEIRPNWNGLVFDGVNGWNILASVGGLYDDDSVVNPLWNELPYKNNVYRNENSEFYNQIETEGE